MIFAFFFVTKFCVFQWDYHLDFLIIIRTLYDTMSSLVYT